MHAHRTDTSPRKFFRLPFYCLSKYKKMKNEKWTTENMTQESWFYRRSFRTTSEQFNQILEYSSHFHFIWKSLTIFTDQCKIDNISLVDNGSLWIFFSSTSLIVHYQLKQKCYFAKLTQFNRITDLWTNWLWLRQDYSRYPPLTLV